MPTLAFPPSPPPMIWQIDAVAADLQSEERLRLVELRDFASEHARQSVTGGGIPGLDTPIETPPPLRRTTIRVRYAKRGVGEPSPIEFPEVE